MRAFVGRICLGIISLFLVSYSFSASTYANDLLNRSVTIGTSAVSANTTYNFKFDIGTVASVGSIVIDFCATSPLYTVACVPPSGLDVSAAVLVSQLGETGFLVDPSTTNNRLVLTRAPVMTSLITARYNFSNIINQDYVGVSYARIATFASTDGSGSRIDSGGLVFATSNKISVHTYVPPYLTFCVGVTVAGDCSSASGEFLGFGELSSTEPKYLTSQYAGATNDPTGFSTSLTGVTMTSGTNVIPALSSPTPSISGVSQFGMNLRANSSPNVGNEPSGIGTSVASVDYNTPNQFVFKNQVISSSPLSTDFNLFTVSYVVNIAESQPPGIYNTTLTYIATAAF